MACRAGMPVLIDEAYHHYVDDPNYATAMPYVNEGRPVIVARTFSKIAGMAAMRSATRWRRRRFCRRCAPSRPGSVNVLAQYGAVAALKDKAAMADVKAKTIAGSREDHARSEGPRLRRHSVADQLLHGPPPPRRAAGHSGVPRGGCARRPSVPADDAAPARLGRHAGRDGPLHGRVQEDHEDDDDNRKGLIGKGPGRRA